MAHKTVNFRITVFKSLAISKVVHLLLITKLHNNTIDLMYKIQRNFILQGKMDMKMEAQKMLNKEIK